MNKQLQDILKQTDTATHKQIELLVRQVVNEYQRTIKEINAKMTDIAERYGHDAQLLSVKTQRLREVEGQIRSTLMRLNVKFENKLKTAIADIYSETWNRTGFAVEQALKTKLGFNVLNGRAIEASLNNDYNLIKWKDASSRNMVQTLRDVKSSITQGLIQGKTIAQTSTELQKRANISANKAVRISRTETHRAHNSARLDSFTQSEESIKELGMKAERIWIATLDTRTRHNHRHLDGKVADSQGFFYFTDGKGKTKAPVHSGIAAEDINCRCTTSLQIKDMKAEKRRVKGEGEVEYKTFEQWKESKKKVDTPTATISTALNRTSTQPPLTNKFTKATTIEEAREKTKSLIQQHFTDIQSVKYADAVTVEQANKMNEQIEKLMNEYEISSVWKTNEPVQIWFKSTFDSFGFIRYWNDTTLGVINFGNQADNARTRMKSLSNPKSIVDVDKLEIATVTHEFAHLISCIKHFHRDSKHREFFTKLKSIKLKYKREIIALARTGRDLEASELYIGNYSGKNLSEFMAEAFTNYKLSSNPSKVSAQVGELIDKYFKKGK